MDISAAVVVIWIGAVVLLWWSDRSLLREFGYRSSGCTLCRRLKL